MDHEETLILGIGNTLLTDEGAGIHALNLLQSDYPDLPNLTYLDGGTLSFTLATWIEDCSSLIVFDAAQLNKPAGTVETFIDDAFDDFLGASKRSAHEVGLLDLMDIARLTGHFPRHRALIGIQPEFMSWGMHPSKPVQDALPEAAAEAARLVNQWQEINTGQEVSVA